MAGSTTESEPAQAELGLWDAVSIIVGIVIGAGIYESPEMVFSSVPGPWMGLVVWVAGGLLAFVGALCYAELATTYPKMGGDYEYLTRAFSPLTGFLFGWAQLTVVLPGSIGAMAFVFADYFDTFAAGAGIPGFYLAAAAVLLLTLLNILGVVFGKTTQNVLTVIKVVGLLGILAVGFLYADPAAWEPRREVTAPFPWGSLAIILVLYTYGGWNDAAFVAAEVRDRRCNIPLALLLGVGIITAVYLLVNLAYLLCLGFDLAADGPGKIAARLMAKTGWELAPQALSLLVMISALGALNGLILTGSRVYSRLGTDHEVFARMGLGRWHPRLKTPVTALWLQALISIVMIWALGSGPGQQALHALLGTLQLHSETHWQARAGFDMLVSCTAPVFWIFFFLTGASLVVLRLRDPATERPFRVPLYPLVPIIFAGMCLYMLYASVTYRAWFTAPAGVLVLLGVPLFFLSRRE
jgi:amino acid transporter